MLDTRARAGGRTEDEPWPAAEHVIGADPGRNPESVTTLTLELHQFWVIG